MIWALVLFAFGGLLVICLNANDDDDDGDHRMEFLT